MKSNLSKLPVTIMENKHNGLQAIKLTEGKFSGIIYTYGKVEFDEDEENDKVFIRFEYDIIEYSGKSIDDPMLFEKYIGDILTEMIHRGLAENSLTYTGGVDENRAEDSKQSDS